METSRGDGGDGDVPWRRVAATPRLRRGYSVEIRAPPAGTQVARFTRFIKILKLAKLAKSGQLGHSVQWATSRTGLPPAFFEAAWLLSPTPRADTRAVVAFRGGGRSDAIPALPRRGTTPRRRGHSSGRRRFVFMVICHVFACGWALLGRETSGRVGDVECFLGEPGDDPNDPWFPIRKCTWHRDRAERFRLLNGRRRRGISTLWPRRRFAEDHYGRTRHPRRYQIGGLSFRHSGDTNGYLYTSCLYFTITTLSTVGYGDYSPNTLVEKALLPRGRDAAPRHDGNVRRSTE